MDFAGKDDVPVALSRGWRRGLVVVTLASVAAVVLLHLLAPDRPRLLHLGEVGFAAVAIGCVWLLADSLRPWIDADRVPAEAQAHADAAVRRSYGVLFWLAFGIVVYLQVIGATSPGAVATDPERVFLWLLVALIVLLPGGIAAWEDVSEGSRAIAVGPAALTMARLRGPWAAAYATGLLALVFAAALLLLLGNSPSTSDGSLPEFASVAVLAVLAALVPWSLRSRGTRRGGRARGRNA